MKRSPSPAGESARRTTSRPSFVATGRDHARRIRWHLGGAEGADGIVYGIGIDVTERLALEKRAADAEALSAMGTLALNLAHEIRNPLNAAKLQLHLLARDVGKLEGEETRVGAPQAARRSWVTRSPD